MFQQNVMQFSTRCYDLREISYFTVLLSVEFCINVRMEEGRKCFVTILE